MIGWILVGLTVTGAVLASFLGVFVAMFNDAGPAEGREHAQNAGFLTMIFGPWVVVAVMVVGVLLLVVRKHAFWWLAVLGVVGVAATWLVGLSVVAHNTA